MLKSTGIQITIITGSEDAQILYETHLAENMDSKNMYLYMDVGGGSTELTFYGKNKQVMKQSFDLGTIRLLKDKIDDDIWDDVKTYVKGIKSNLPIVAIGSGGNINKLFSLSKRKPDKPLTLEMLREYYKEMSAMSVEDRIHRYGFRQDRADVIVPALLIYTLESSCPHLSVSNFILYIFNETLKPTLMLSKKSINKLKYEVMKQPYLPQSDSPQKDIKILQVKGSLF